MNNAILIWVVWRLFINHNIHSKKKTEYKYCRYGRMNQIVTTMSKFSLNHVAGNLLDENKNKIHKKPGKRQS